jgi:RHS repeat-associated protein
MYTGAYIYYAHDHLYSPVALVYTGGVVLERYEYDAYGNCHVLEPNFAADPDGKSDYGNPYLFTGRRVDILDNGFLKIQYNRNRYYDYYTGRWTIHDPIGMRPTGAISPLTSALLAPPVQYYYGMNLYEYLSSNPANAGDPLGLWGWYVHYARTRDWVKGTNLWCHADDIARWNYSMDKGLNNPPLAWAITTVADIIATVKGWFFMMPITDAYMRHIAYWHFPGADLGMPVGPGLWPAWREVHKGIKLCDLEVFGKGLHQLQDSYSHQSNGRLPPWYGRNMVGHSRDRHGWNTEKWDDPKATGLRSGLIATARSIRGGTTLLKEWRMIVVAVSSDADIPSRSAAIGASYFRARLATMKAIDAFLDKCECVKEGPDAGKCLHCAKKKP